MKEITVVKTEKGFRGWTEEDQRAYSRMRARMEALEPGEFARVGFSTPRHGPFHRKFFAMLNVAFEAWEPMNGRKRRMYRGQPIAKNFELFREEVLILSGYGIPSFDIDGRLRWKAKSISFDEMHQEEFEGVYSAVADVLLEQILDRYDRAELDRVVEQLVHFT